MTMTATSSRLARRRAGARRTMTVFHGTRATTARPSRPWAVVARVALIGRPAAKASQPVTNAASQHDQQRQIGPPTGSAQRIHHGPDQVLNRCYRPKSRKRERDCWCFGHVVRNLLGRRRGDVVGSAGQQTGHLGERSLGVLGPRLDLALDGIERALQLSGAADSVVVLHDLAAVALQQPRLHDQIRIVTGEPDLLLVHLLGIRLDRLDVPAQHAVATRFGLDPHALTLRPASKSAARQRGQRAIGG